MPACLDDERHDRPKPGVADQVGIVGLRNRGDRPGRAEAERRDPVDLDPSPPSPGEGTEEDTIVRGPLGHKTSLRRRRTAAANERDLRGR